MHNFMGKWITDGEFFDLAPRNVFHRQLDKVDIDCTEHRNRHILFRKKFTLDKLGEAKMYITADDYYKLYINGKFAAQGPAPSYHFEYNYNVIDVTEYLKKGENTVAVHTLYQGLINRVWQSGDLRHGLICDLTVDGAAVMSSDESFKTMPHDGFREMHTVGYATQFMEEYDARAAAVGFEMPDYDDSSWSQARLHECADHTLREQTSGMLVFEKIQPAVKKREGDRLFVDFGYTYVGYLCLTVNGGRAGDTVTLRFGQELEADGSVRHILRCNCRYEERFILAEGVSVLDQFDYKSFRYAELTLPEGCDVTELYMNVRHYPFTLKAKMKPEYEKDEKLRAIWELCVHTQKYGVQEVIQDCMEREKGFYVGDGCYTALANMILTGDDSMVRKLIDDAFTSSFITDGLVTCLDCSFMQEIAEYPLILVYLTLWHYRLTEDKAYLASNFPKICRLLDSYRRDYEKDGILSHLDKWCVVDWPENFRDGYDVDIKEGKVCEEAHVSINSYYIEAIRCANRIAELIGEEKYRDETPLLEAFVRTFYLPERHAYRDGEQTEHISFTGNTFPYGFLQCPDAEFEAGFEATLKERGISAFSFFGSFVVMMGLARREKYGLIHEMLLDEGAWLRILREGGTTTFEGWGRDTKKNTSLFHLTMSYAVIFLSDTDVKGLFS